MTPTPLSVLKALFSHYQRLDEKIYIHTHNHGSHAEIDLLRNAEVLLHFRVDQVAEESREALMDRCATMVLDYIMTVAVNSKPLVEVPVTP
jgi:hypothetical protein